MPLLIGNNLGTRPVSSVTSNNSGTGLQNIVFAAANTGASSISGAGPYALPTSKDAYYNLQQRAAEACFADKTLRDFVLASAQKTNGQARDASAVALLGCAVNLYVIDPDLGSSLKMGQVKKDLTELAKEFQKRPALSIVTCDLGDSAPYNAYQNLKTQINGLLAAAPAGVDRVFESVQSRIAQAYLVDGLRAGVEGSWGQLTAQSVQALMRNGNYSDAAGKVLASQLKLAEASRNGDGLAELVRQSLKMLDLHRPGQAAGPGANNHTAPAAPSGVPIQHCLTCCHGHGHAPLNLTVNGGAGGSATNGLSGPEFVRLVESLRRSGSDTQATNNQPVNNPPEYIPLVKIPRATIQPDNITRENTQPDNIPHFELSNSQGGGAVRVPSTNHRHVQSTSNSGDPLRRGISSSDQEGSNNNATNTQPVSTGSYNNYLDYLRSFTPQRGGTVRAQSTNHRHAQSTSNSSDPLRRGISSSDQQGSSNNATNTQLVNTGSYNRFRTSFGLSNSQGGGAAPTAAPDNLNQAQPDAPLSSDISSSDLQNGTGPTAKQTLLEKLKTNTAGVTLILKNVPTFSHKHIDPATVAKTNAHAVSSAISTGVSADAQFKDLKNMLLEETPSWTDIKANHAFQALCEFNQSFKSKVESLLVAQNLNFASSSSYAPYEPVHLTGGTNRFNYNLTQNQRPPSDS